MRAETNENEVFKFDSAEFFYVLQIREDVIGWKEIASDKSGINNFPRHTQINLSYTGGSGARDGSGNLVPFLPSPFERMNSVSNPGKREAKRRVLGEPIK